MEEDIRRRLLEKNLAFFGVIAAGVSHEMRNVLSIVGEYAGLLDDLLAAAERGKPVDPEKLKRLSTKITRQVKKGTEAMERFSYFAHAADQQTASVDLNAVARNVVGLAERKARLVGCTLQSSLPDEPMETVTDPFSLQHAVFAGIRWMLESPARGQIVTIQVARKGANGVISIGSGAAELDGAVEPAPDISTLMAQLGGTLETSVQDGKHALILTLPLK
jgi:nitrogen fixation/metabolism regulation signal transduction histidine kinase